LIDATYNVHVTGSLWLICKGAETAIFERTTSGDIDLIEQHINDFAMVMDLVVLTASFKALDAAQKDEAVVN
jgi:hypothetical protein